MPIPIKPDFNLKIFEKLPPAIKETFHSGIPLGYIKETVQVMILYSPDLQLLGYYDNTKCDTTGSQIATSYSITNSSGFTFTFGQKISAEINFEVNVTFGKFSTKFGLELSFSEQWNTSQAETIQFSVPAGKKAYVYKGILKACVLKYDPKDGKYSYSDEKGRFKTNHVMTVEEPLIGPAQLESFTVRT